MQDWSGYAHTRATVMGRVTLAVFWAESVAVTTTLKLPCVVGLPEITPPVEIDNPAGSDDPLAAVHDHVYGPPFPPVTDIVDELPVGG